MAARDWAGEAAGMDFRVWFAELLRFVRRDADMSQRELARWSGVSKSTIADIETGISSVPLAVAVALLRTAGFDLLIRGPTGQVVDELLFEQRRDAVGRRFPPHLDLRPKRDDELAGEQRDRAPGRPPPSRWTFRLDRQVRDYLRCHGWYGELGTVPAKPRHPDVAFMAEHFGVPAPPLAGLFRQEEESGPLRTREWPSVRRRPKSAAHL